MATDNTHTTPARLVLLLASELERMEQAQLRAMESVRRTMEAHLQAHKDGDTRSLNSLGELQSTGSAVEAHTGAVCALEGALEQALRMELDWTTDEGWDLAGVQRLARSSARVRRVLDRAGVPLEAG